MDMLYKVLIGFFLSSVKYLLGVGWCMGYFSNHYISFIITLLGGAFGVVVFTYFGHAIRNWFLRFRKKKKNTFTARNRKLVKIRQYGGLSILALLTPVIVSIPVGCMLANTFVSDRRRILLFMFSSLILWSLVIFGSLEFFNVDLTSIFE